MRVNVGRLITLVMLKVSYKSAGYGKEDFRFTSDAKRINDLIFTDMGKYLKEHFMLDDDHSFAHIR